MNLTTQLRPPIALVLAGLGVLLTLVVLLATTTVATPQRLIDPGVAIRYGLPTLTVLRDLAGALTVGAGLLAATSLPRPHLQVHASRRHDVLPDAVATSLRRIVLTAAVTWAVVSFAHILVTYADITGTSFSDPLFGNQVVHAMGNIALFQYLTFALCCAVITSIVAALAVGPTATGWVAGVGAVGWYSIALTGHAAGAGNHELAVSGWWLHIIGVSVWFGGVLVLVLVGRHLAASNNRAVIALIRRSSALFGWAAAIVVLSGVASGALRVGSRADLATQYGWLLVLKTVLTAALLAAGFGHRKWLLATLQDASTRLLFWRLIVGELVLFGAVMAVAGVLSRSEPPIPDSEIITEGLTPAQIVTGEPLPEFPQLSSYWTQWRWDILWVVLVVILLERYLRAVVTLHRRGDRWPLWRTVTWCVAVLSYGYLLNGAPAVYGRLLFSSHMLQHMLMSMTVPLLFVLGSPLVLLLRVTAARHDGSMGWRELVLGITGSRYIKFFTNPVVAAVNFTGSIIVFYFSPLFALAIATHVGHVLMTIHFTLAGYLFAEVLIGDDPGIKRPPHPVRLVILFVTMAFHAFFGVTLTTSDSLIAATYFSSLGWGIDLLADQVLGGNITWGVGEIPTLGLAVGVVLQWLRSDTKEAKRFDREADRDQDQKLAEYNRMLAGLDDDQPPSSGRG